MTANRAVAIIGARAADRHGLDAAYRLGEKKQTENAKFFGFSYCADFLASFSVLLWIVFGSFLCCSPRFTFRRNYSIYLIVSRLRFKSTKLNFTGFTSPISTISAFLKHPFFTYAKVVIFAYSCKFVLSKKGF